MNYNYSKNNRCKCGKLIINTAKMCRNCFGKSEIGKHYSSLTEIKKGEHLSIKTQIKKKQHLSLNTEFKKGNIPWNKNQSWDRETRKKMSNARKDKKFPKTSKTMKLLWKNQEYRDNQIKLISKGWAKVPNKPEKNMSIILNKIYPNQYKYVGNRKLFLDGLCPDFVNLKDKKIIELYGDYWHKRVEHIIRDKRRIKTYKKYGYKTLIIWEHELKNLDKLINKLIKF